MERDYLSFVYRASTAADACPARCETTIIRLDRRPSRPVFPIAIGPSVYLAAELVGPGRFE